MYSLCKEQTHGEEGVSLDHRTELQGENKNIPYYLIYWWNINKNKVNLKYTLLDRVESAVIGTGSLNLKP